MLRTTTIAEYRSLYHLSLTQPEKLWAAEAACIDWFHPFAQDRLNAAYNCVDRHAQNQPNKVAIPPTEPAQHANRCPLRPTSRKSAPAERPDVGRA